MTEGISHDAAAMAATRCFSGRQNRDDERLLLKYIGQQRDFSAILPELENLKGALAGLESAKSLA